MRRSRSLGVQVQVEFELVRSNQVVNPMRVMEKEWDEDEIKSCSIVH